MVTRLLELPRVDQISDPIIFNIAKIFEAFSKKYYCTGKNYLRAFILCNPIFGRGRGDNGILCKRFFGENLPNQILEKIAKLRLEDLLMRGVIKSLAQINTDLGIDFTLVTYMRLSAAITYFIEIKQNVPPAVPVGICTFLMSFEKGSRKIRRALSSQSSNINVDKLTSVVTFHNITETGNVVVATIKNAISFWNFSAQKNTVREFAFKFMNNQLGLNTRVFFFNFLLWNMKLKKNILHFSTLENNWLELLDKAHKQSQKNS